MSIPIRLDAYCRIFSGTTNKESNILPAKIVIKISPNWLYKLIFYIFGYDWTNYIMQFYIMKYLVDVLTTKNNTECQLDDTEYHKKEFYTYISKELKYYNKQLGIYSSKFCLNFDEYEQTLKEYITNMSNIKSIDNKILHNEYNKFNIFIHKNKLIMYAITPELCLYGEDCKKHFLFCSEYDMTGFEKSDLDKKMLIRYCFHYRDIIYCDKNNDNKTIFEFFNDMIVDDILKEN